MQEAKPESPLLQLTVTDPLGLPHSVTVSSNDLVAEVKAAFLEFAPTSYFTECTFELAGQPLDMYQTLLELQVPTGATLNMKVDLYSERGVRLHVERLKAVLKFPPPCVSYMIDVEGQPEEQLQPASDPVIPPFSGEEFLPDPSKLPSPPSLLHPYKLEEEVWTSVKCLNYLIYSPAPPKGRRVLLGDVSYLEAQVLEGNVLYITAHTGGFYINNSKFDSSGLFEFLPEPCETPCHSLTLVGLLEQASPMFKSHFHQLLHISTEWESLRHVKSIAEVQTWVHEEQQSEWEAKVDSAMDWNEALQQCKSLPATGFLQRIQRDKQLAQVYSEFLEAAIAGAKGVIMGSFLPLNPNDPKSLQVYVNSHIFFSYTEDKEYQQETGGEACATHISTSHDIRAINILNSMAIEGLHTIATATVDYRGHRVLCQSILPGILSQTPETSTKYGSLDDGLTYASDPDFHTLVCTVAERLHLSSSVLLDKEGARHTLAAGYDLKGMVGSDKRKYLLENARITPRDANKEGSEFSLCLLRPELVEHFQQVYRRSQIDLKIEQLREEKKQACPEDAEKAKLTVEEIKEVIASVPPFLFNPNVFTSANFADSVSEEETKVRDLSSFLTSVQIPMTAKVLCSEQNWWPRLGTSLVDVLHQFGVNARYLGAVAKAITSPEFQFVKWQCEVTAVARAAKHVLNRYLRESPDHLLAAVITHLLNCVFNLPKRNEVREEGKEGKKKRKKKAKKVVSGVPKHPLLSLRREEVWSEVVSFADSHFDLQVPSKLDDWEAVKLPSFRTFLLREICLQIGLQLAPSSLVDKFTTESISGLTYRVKAPEVKSVESKWLYDAALRAVGEKNYQMAMELLLQSAGVQESISGPVHRDIANCYQHISGIHMAEGDLQHAIMFQHRALVLSERALGLDHPLVAQEYVTFAQLYQAAGRTDRACRHLIRACELFAINGCEHCIDAINCLSSLAMLYADNARHDLAVVVMTRMLELFTSMLGETHMRVADCCEVMAFQYKCLGDYDKAVACQVRALQVFQRLLPADDPRIRTAQTLLEAFSKHSADLQDDARKESGTSKSGKTDRSAMLRQRLHLRKMQSKMNLPRGRLLASPQFLQDLSTQFTQEQIEEEKTRLLIEEIKQKNARR